MILKKTLLPKKVLRIQKSGLEGQIQRFFKTAVLKNRKRGLGGSTREKDNRASATVKKKTGMLFVGHSSIQTALAGDLPPASTPNQRTSKTPNEYYCFCDMENNNIVKQPARPIPDGCQIDS